MNTLGIPLQFNLLLFSFCVPGIGFWQTVLDDFEAASPARAGTPVSLISAKGRLLPYNDRGDRLPDFSQVGYRGGDEDVYPAWRDLPELRVDAEGADHADRIQAAIDRAATLPLNQDGYRALVLLSGDAFHLDQTVRMHSSGIVLAGLARDGGIPRLVFEPREQATAILIEGTGEPEMDMTRATALTVDYLPSGSPVLPVADAKEFQPGDQIIVRHAFNQKWIEALGMDRIPSKWVTGDDGVRRDATVQWTPQAYIYAFRRRVERIDENNLVLDIPLPMPLDAEFGQTTIAPCTYAGEISHVGVRDLEIVSVFDPAIRAPYPHDQEKFHHSDEQHGAWAIQVDKATGGWIHNITARHFVMGAVHLSWNSSRFTVSGCRCLQPVSRITGGRRYSFFISGQLNLVKNCSAAEGRHDFVLNRNVPGPNVFFNCHSKGAHSGSEPHHRMAFGALYDNVEVTGPAAYIGVFNRGDSGTGHGWAGAQIVLWNASSPLLIAQSPPIYQNFIFGVGSPVDLADPATVRYIQDRLTYINSQSGKAFTFDGQTPVIGDGHIESRQGAVSPPSLYQFQRAQRPPS